MRLLLLLLLLFTLPVSAADINMSWRPIAGYTCYQLGFSPDKSNVTITTPDICGSSGTITVPNGSQGYLSIRAMGGAFQCAWGRWQRVRISAGGTVLRPSTWRR